MTSCSVQIKFHPPFCDTLLSLTVISATGIIQNTLVKHAKSANRIKCFLSNTNELDTCNRSINRSTRSIYSLPCMYPLVGPFINRSIHPSNQSINKSIHLLSQTAIYIYIYIYTHPSVHPLIVRSIHPRINQSIINDQCAHTVC
jgi:hypothetical protein